MPDKRDYYDILGLSKNASETDIKRAYKKLAKQYHPDVSQDANAEEKFKEVQEAYSVLRDSQKKANYDQFGHSFEGFQGNQGGADFNFDDIFSSFGGMGGGFSDLFRDAFGMGGQKGGPTSGNNLRVDLAIRFEDAAFGIEKEITVERIGGCAACTGSGSEDGKQKTCPMCNGSGRIAKTQRTPFGVFSMQSVCHQCKGAGSVIEKPCKQCHGEGVQREHKKLKVTIPAGINTGNHLRLQGEGNAGTKGGRAGDLFVVVFVEPHDIFKRDDVDVFCEIPISFSEAALGTIVEAPTLYGKADLKIKAGTQTGTLFRLKGKGIKRLQGNGIGDEYVKVIIETPKRLSKKQKALFEEMKGEETVQKERKGLFDKIVGKFT
jgi:molecular chaperone DnaJ